MKLVSREGSRFVLVDSEAKIRSEGVRYIAAHDSRQSSFNIDTLQIGPERTVHVRHYVLCGLKTKPIDAAGNIETLRPLPDAWLASLQEADQKIADAKAALKQAELDRQAVLEDAYIRSKPIKASVIAEWTKQADAAAK